MKKLMILAAVACASVLAHGAAANWKASASGIYNGTGSDADSALYNGTALLFDAAVTSQSALYDVISGGTAISSSTAGYVGSATVADGAFGGVTFSNGDQGGGSYTYYFVIVDGDKAYFSNEKSATANATATAKNVGFSSQSGSVALPSGTTFAGAGKWSATVPEPTSGLLMLVGLGALALRRRRA